MATKKRHFQEMRTPGCFIGVSDWKVHPLCAALDSIPSRRPAASRPAARKNFPASGNCRGGESCGLCSRRADRQYRTASARHYFSCDAAEHELFDSRVTVSRHDNQIGVFFLRFFDDQQMRDTGFESLFTGRLCAQTHGAHIVSQKKQYRHGVQETRPLLQRQQERKIAGDAQGRR